MVRLSSGLSAYPSRRHTSNCILESRPSHGVSILTSSVSKRRPPIDTNISDSASEGKQRHGSTTAGLLQQPAFDALRDPVENVTHGGVVDHVGPR